MVEFPFPVNIDKFNNNDNNDNKTQVLVYFKNRKMEELFLVIKCLEKYNFNEIVVYNYNIKYDETNFINDIKKSKFGVVIAAHESQGFAIEEMLSLNLPLLVWSVLNFNQEEGYEYPPFYATTVPYWDYRCGEVFYVSDELEEYFNIFLSKLHLYKPREFIVENLSVKPCSIRFLNLINNKRLYPITFSIPKEKVVNDFNKKEKLLSNLIPDDKKTYIYNTEKDYYDEYRKSYFAVTKMKSGWDCMRHYEIIANGCIPYFIDIEKCPINTLALCPKNLFKEANSLFNIFYSKVKDNIITENDIDTYNNLRSRFLEYMRNHLTTDKMANYILEKTKFRNVSRILYLSQDLVPDYLRCLTLHGFKELFGKNCHDYPKIPHLYKSDNNYSHLYGKGITYSNLLDHELHDNKLDDSIETDIKNRYYDIIIYGSYHRGMPYYNLVNSVYKPNEIILLCGEDIHDCDYREYLNKGHYIFVREL